MMYISFVLGEICNNINASTCKHVDPITTPTAKPNETTHQPTTNETTSPNNFSCPTPSPQPETVTCPSLTPVATIKNEVPTDENNSLCNSSLGQAGK